MAPGFRELHPSFVAAVSPHATPHRAWPFDDPKYRRQRRRVTTPGIAEPARVAGGS